jgi:hypothetical protein
MLFGFRLNYLINIVKSQCSWSVNIVRYIYLGVHSPRGVYKKRRMRGKVLGEVVIPDRKDKVIRDDQKIDDVTKGLQDSYFIRIKKLPKKQKYVICDYMFALSTEIKMSYTYRQSILNTVITLAKSSGKAFKDFTRTDVVAYMNYFKKGESEDPKHKWIGTYNTNLVNVIRFFRWS